MAYTGRYLYRMITDVETGYGLPHELAVLSIRAPLAAEWDAIPGGIAHHLKTDPIPFESAWRGEKTCEVRSTRDRAFAVGQIIKLEEHLR